MIDAFIFPTRVKFALKFPVKPVLAVKLLSWRCSAIQLDEVGSAIASLLSLVHFVERPVVIKTEKECYMYRNLKHAYFSVRNPLPIPIKCSISMVKHTNQ